MSGALTRFEAEELLYREALLMDGSRFDEWLDLFTKDVEFWMPAWIDETKTTVDPERELSLIYYRGRRNLEDRVMRLTSGMSIASTPLPRVVHQVTNVLVTEASTASGRISAAFTCNRFDVRMNRSDIFYGRYEYRVIKSAGDWKIAAKKIILLNDTIPTVVDINSI